MINVSNNYKNELNTKLSFSPKSKIVVNGVEYLGDVIKTSPKISHSNTSFIGGFPAKTLSFDIYNLNNDLDFENKEISVYKGLMINGSVEWVKQGVFIPQAKDITNNVSTKVMTISNAQDRTQLLDDKYESSLDWTNNQNHTGLEIVQEICTKKSITLETTNFAWSNYSFKQPNFNENTTYREIISRLAEIGGEVALFTSNGGLAIKGQYTTGDTIQRARYEKLSKEKTIIINTLVLGKDGIEDNIVYPETITGDRVEYKILDNPFVDLYREEMISTVASYIIGKSYTPFNIQGFVDGFVYELNDVLSVVDKNGNTFNAVVLDYSSQSRIKSNIKAEVKEKVKTNYNLVGSKASAINQVKVEVDHINDTITALSSRVEDLTDYLKEVTGTGSIVLNDTTESEGAIGKLTISGFTEMGLYPSMVYPSSNVYPSKLTTYIIVQTNGTDTRETYIDLGRILTSTDELIIENNKLYLKNGSTITDMNMEFPLKTYKGTTTISVKYFDNVNLTCSYIIENELTKVFATQTEVSAQFTITNESINSKVSKGEVVSEINQSAEAVKISANKINLNGYVSNEDKNFEITPEGKAKFVDVTITGGNINLPSGGKVIGGDGILTNLQYSSVGYYEGYGLLGFNVAYNGDTPEYYYSDISVDVDIPDNFTVVSAYLTLYHTPAYWSYYSNGNVDVWGYARNLKLYESSGTDQNYKFYLNYGGEYKTELDSSYLAEITNGFGASSYQPTNTSLATLEVKKSINIKDYLSTSGVHKLVVRSNDSVPTSEATSCTKTGMARAVVNIIGYMSM